MGRMKTGRRVLTAIVLVGATATAVPATASAQGCTLADASVGIQYEADLFLQQTSFDLSRLTAANTAAFTTATVQRAAAMTTAIANTTVALATGAPVCRR